MIELKRAQMRMKDQPGTLDITVKSAQGVGRFLAPTWDMVLSHKQGTIDDSTYTWQYEMLLCRQVTAPVLEALVQLGSEHDNQLTLLCYCPDGRFCHTVLAARWLSMLFPTLFSTQL